MLDEDAFGRLLLRVEADVHRGGWDQRELLLALVDAAAEPDTAAGFRRMMAGAGPGVRVGDYLGQPMFGQQFFATAGVAPYEALRAIALNVAYGPAEHEDVTAMRGVLRSPGVFGFAMVSESWGNDDPEVGRRAIAGEVNLGDVPGSYEARGLIAVTVAGRVMRVVRVRGRKPELRPDEERLRGDFSTSLRILCDVVADRVPPVERFREAYPSLAEMVTLR